jgi:hypothetical protein
MRHQANGREAAPTACSRRGSGIPPSTHHPLGATPAPTASGPHRLGRANGSRRLYSHDKAKLALRIAARVNKSTSCLSTNIQSHQPTQKPTRLEPNNGHQDRHASKTQDKGPRNPRWRQWAGNQDQHGRNQGQGTLEGASGEGR